MADEETSAVEPKYAFKNIEGYVSPLEEEEKEKLWEFRRFNLGLGKHPRQEFADDEEYWSMNRDIFNQELARLSPGSPSYEEAQRRAAEAARQVTQIKLYEKRENENKMSKLENEAYKDELTGLGNRKERKKFLDGLPEQHQSICFSLDLVGFKKVNDSIGHEAGDVVLQTVAQRIKKLVRPSDSVIRTGGDEFCIIITESLSPDQIKQKVGEIQDSIAQKIEVEGKKGKENVEVGVRVGVARRVDYKNDKAWLNASDADERDKQDLGAKNNQST